MLRALCSTLCLLALPVTADPALTELKTALAAFAVEKPFRAELNVTVKHQLGQGDNANLREGQAQITVRTDDQGIHWGYSPEDLANKQRERKKTIQDPDADTPLLTAQTELNLSSIARHVSALEHLQRWVELSEYQGYTNTRLQGQPARILTFHYGIERLSSRETRYVNNYRGELKIWIDPQGTPLRSEVSTRLSGRAFVFVRFSSDTDESREYQVFGDRLITRRSHFHSDSAGAGERSVSRLEFRLSPIDEEG